MVKLVQDLKEIQEIINKDALTFSEKMIVAI